MVSERNERAQRKWACVRFIAELSLLHHCKKEELEMALWLIADMAESESTTAQERDIFYQVE
ncbi:MAG: hypothetical protein H6R25_3325 [Proteobacteria bacterium]|nr:hypothetical protein [Pseudomonadota bacterium]